jgi:hypothetical protein
MQEAQYPVQFSVDYPDRDLNRLTTFFRIFVAIPILIILATVSGGEAGSTARRLDRRRRLPREDCFSLVRC